MTNPLGTDLIAHQGWMLLLARKLVRDRDTAMDLVQDTFVRVLQNPPRGGATLRQWLWTTLHRRAIDHARMKRSAPRKEGFFEETATTPGEEWRHAQSEIYFLISQLPETQRRIIDMRFVDGFTRNEIAERLNLSRAYVSEQTTEALSTLREKLKKRSKGATMLGLGPLLWVMKPIKKLLSVMALLCVVAVAVPIGVAFVQPRNLPSNDSLALAAPQLDPLPATEAPQASRVVLNQSMERPVTAPEPTAVDPGYTAYGTLTWNGEPAVGWEVKMVRVSGDSRDTIARMETGPEGKWNLKARDGIYYQVWLEHPSNQLQVMLDCQSEEDLRLDFKVSTAPLTVPRSEGLTLVRQGPVLAYSMSSRVEFAPVGDLEILEVGESQSPDGWRVKGHVFNAGEVSPSQSTSR